MSRRTFSEILNLVPERPSKILLSENRRIRACVKEIKSFNDYEQFADFYQENVDSFAAYTMKEWIEIAAMCPLPQFDWICQMFSLLELRTNNLFCDDNIFASAILIQDNPEVLHRIVADYLTYEHNDGQDPCSHGQDCLFHFFFLNNGVDCLALKFAEMRKDSSEFVSEINDIISLIHENNILDEEISMEISDPSE